MAGLDDEFVYSATLGSNVNTITNENFYHLGDENLTYFGAIGSRISGSPRGFSSTYFGFYNGKLERVSNSLYPEVSTYDSHKAQRLWVRNVADSLVDLASQKYDIEYPIDWNKCDDISPCSAETLFAGPSKTLSVRYITKKVFHLVKNIDETNSEIEEKKKSNKKTTFRKVSFLYAYMAITYLQNTDNKAFAEQELVTSQNISTNTDYKVELGWRPPGELKPGTNESATSIWNIEPDLFARSIRLQ